MNPSLFAVAALLAITMIMSQNACSTHNRKPLSDGDDPHLWLEEVEGQEALAWVRAHNDKTLPELQKDPRYAGLEADLRKVLLAKDRIPTPGIRGGWVYNFWQDPDHVRGIWRRTSLQEYRKVEPQWDVILDIDALGKKENESWVWKDLDCLAPKYERCLITLSRGGKDASVVREFDLSKRDFVTDGFTLPEAKSSVGWKDENTIWVGTDFGQGSLTHSGYPRLVKLWKRGTPLSQAQLIFEGSAEDVSATGMTIFSPEGVTHGIVRSPSFFESEQWIWTEGASGPELRKVPFPKDADFKGVFKGQLMALLRTDWGQGKRVFKSGTLVSLPVDEVARSGERLEIGKQPPTPVQNIAPPASLQTIYAPDSRSTLEGISRTRSHLYLQVLQNVNGRILEVSHKGAKGWGSRKLPLPDLGSASVAAADPYEGFIIAHYESFAVPTTLYLSHAKKGSDSIAKFEPIKRLPDRFDASGMQVSQRESKSADGTRVPYFLIHKKGLKLDGSNPTLLYGYGGFEISLSPTYQSTKGKVWLERGGVYALANIRGGGEFGPKWHQAALLKNRQRAFDDFISVAEDLISSRITSPKHLGIMGGSNGGLLMGVMLTQRPDLFGAVVCQVPLLDMLRYHKLLAGASWVGEYGNPEDPEMAPIIAKYSPYQNVKAGAGYPRAFFVTSTKDDRVHPGHARKMVARLEEMGHSVLYYENIEGGHSAAADLEQQVKRTALEFTYLDRQLR